MKPDLGFMITGKLDGLYVIAVDPEGPACDAGLIDGDAIETLDGLGLAEFRASPWWPRPAGKPIKAVYSRGGVRLRANIVIDVFDAPATSMPSADAAVPAVPVLEAAAPAAPAPDPRWKYGRPGCLPEADLPGTPIGQHRDVPWSAAATPADDRWKYGRGPASFEAGYAGGAPRFPADTDNWPPSMAQRVPVVRPSEPETFDPVTWLRRGQSTEGR